MYDVTLAISNAIQTQTLKVLELTLSGLILLLHDKSLQQFPLQPVSCVSVDVSPVSCLQSQLNDLITKV